MPGCTCRVVTCPVTVEMTLPFSSASRRPEALAPHASAAASRTHPAPGTSCSPAPASHTSPSLTEDALPPPSSERIRDSRGARVSAREDNALEARAGALRRRTHPRQPGRTAAGEVRPGRAGISTGTWQNPPAAPQPHPQRQRPTGRAAAPHRRRHEAGVVLREGRNLLRQSGLRPARTRGRELSVGAVALPPRARSRGRAARAPRQESSGARRRGPHPAGARERSGSATTTTRGLYARPGEASADRNRGAQGVAGGGVPMCVLCDGRR